MTTIFNNNLILFTALWNGVCPDFFISDSDMYYIVNLPSDKYDKEKVKTTIENMKKDFNFVFLDENKLVKRGEKYIHCDCYSFERMGANVVTSSNFNIRHWLKVVVVIISLLFFMSLLIQFWYNKNKKGGVHNQFTEPSIFSVLRLKFKNIFNK